MSTPRAASARPNGDTAAGDSNQINPATGSAFGCTTAGVNGCVPIQFGSARAMPRFVWLKPMTKILGWKVNYPS